MKEISRRDFLKAAGLSAGSLLFSFHGVEGSVDDNVRIRLYADMQTLDPPNYNATPEMAIGRAIYSKLVRFKPYSYELENDAVKSINQSSDGLEVTFELKKGINWHRGYGELTAEDVKFSLERAANPEVSSYSQDLETLDRVQITDKYKGKMIFTEPFAPLWTSSLPWCVGDIICKKAYDDLGDEYWTNPVGSGPYMFADWTPKQEIVLKRFDGYYGEQPSFQRVTFKPIQDEKTAELSFDAGELDFTEISYSSVSRYENKSKVNFEMYPSKAFQWLGMNVQKPPFDDVRVRRAIKYAVDTKSIVNSAYFSVPEVGRTLIVKGILGHWEDAPLYEPDLEKAKNLLQAAGHSSGFKTELSILNKTQYKTVAEIIKANLAKIGINVKINLMDSGTFWNITFGESGKDVELIHYRYSMAPDPSWATVWFTTGQIGKWNAMRWSNEEYDRLHHEGVVTLDEDKRREIYIEMQKIMDNAAVAEWITHGARPYISKPGIKPAITPLGDLQIRSFKKNV